MAAVSTLGRRPVWVWTAVLFKVMKIPLTLILCRQMNSYRVTLTATAVKERRRIDPAVRKRIDRALRGLQLEPRPSGVKKLSGQHQDWPARVGDYRILYEIDDYQNCLVHCPSPRCVSLKAHWA